MLDLFNALLRKISIAPRRKGRRAASRSAVHEQLEARTMLTTAVADTYYGNANGTTTIPAAQGVLANDSGSSLTAVLVSNPYYGNVTLNSDGSFTYTNTSMSQGDQFSYKDFDGTSYSNVATVTMNLSSNGAAPHATNDTGATVVHDRTLNVSAPGVLSNDSDPNHLPITSVVDTNATHGTVTVNSNGSYSYTPAYHYTGPDSFTYEDYNGYQYSSPATVSLSVTNQSPAAGNAGYALENDQTLNVSAASGVLAYSGDPDGDTLTASLATGVSHGTLALHADGSFSYTPTPGWVGVDSFTYQDSDGVLSSNTATVTLHTEYSVLSAVDQTSCPSIPSTWANRY